MTAYTPDYVCSVWMGFDKTGIDKGKTTSRYKAYPGKVVQMLLKHLQKNDSNKIYPEQPSTVIKDGNEYYKKGTSHSHHASETTEEATEEQTTENTDDTTSQDTGNQETTDQGNTDQGTGSQGNQDSSTTPDTSQNTNQ